MNRSTVYHNIINPCTMYAEIDSTGEVFKINGFKVEYDTITVYKGSAVAGYSEERYMLDEIILFEKHTRKDSVKTWEVED